MTQQEYRFLVSHLECPVCGGPFRMVFPNGTPRYRSHGVPKFCSHSCYIGGERHWNWQGGIAPERDRDMMRHEYRNWRTLVFKRDGYTCRDCGERGGNLNAHHILAYSTHPEARYDVSNGVTLCESCHHNY